MKALERPQHPDVTYWSCPRGDARVVIRGDIFGIMSVIGQEIEPSDLAGVLPQSELETAEALVEQHEAIHGAGVPR
jgi:hypothetical protein